jgi:asparagine synthase (glutamine-hydrolysing)
MCGVAGIIDFQGGKNNTQSLASMLGSISYRGPDESGIWHSDYATIGNVRLSILDPSNGQQPMCDASGRFWITHNGEVFNFQELRTDLKKMGCRFRTNTDTEVIVNSYASYGRKCLEKFNGQFAFAIWDTHEKELFIARDRVGIRPLFYNLTNQVFSFASEIKALFQQKDITTEIDPESLAQIYTFWSTLTPCTVFKNISELSPGHFLFYNRKGLHIEKYWSLDLGKKHSGISFEDANLRFDELFSNATRLRLKADVEVAAFLSGGIDSSATVSYIKQIEPGILNTFSIGFSEKEFDESLYQDGAVRFFETNHKAITCSAADIAEIFPRVVWQAETAMTRTAPAPMMILSKLVRDNGIKVVITGEGSDEILAGYDIFREAKIRRFWASQPDSVFRPLLLHKIYPDIPHLKKASPGMLRMFFGFRLNDTQNPFYSHLVRWNNSMHIKKHFSPEIRQVLNGYSPLDELEQLLPAEFSDWDHLAQAQWIETTVFMSGYLLSTQGDRMGMSNSIEGRYPFLDYRLVEFCAGLPAEFKLKGLNEKYLLKHLTKGKIPENIRTRPKQPYRAPIKSVFLGPGRPEYVKEMLSDSFTKKAGIFDHSVLSETLSRIDRTGVASEVDQMLITAVISTHLLYNQYIENNNTEFSGGKLNNLRIINDHSAIRPTPLPGGAGGGFSTPLPGGAGGGFFKL